MDFTTAAILMLRIHAGQTDKNGDPYCLHLLRVALRGETEDERIVGISHDSVEDKKTTLDELRTYGYAEHLCAAIDALTKREGESYEDFIERILENPLATKVKLADIEDNLDPNRLARLHPVTQVTLRLKYEPARKRLLQALAR